VLGQVREAMRKQTDYATEDAHGDLSCEELMRRHQDAAEKSATATLTALDKLQPDSVPALTLTLPLTLTLTLTLIIFHTLEVEL